MALLDLELVHSRGFFTGITRIACTLALLKRVNGFILMSI